MDVQTANASPGLADSSGYNPLGEVRKSYSYKNYDIGQGRGVYISTYGCQMNVNDTERMYALLEMANFIPVSSADQAELIIINACSIREKPVHKVYSEVGTYRKLKMAKPGLKIGVGGCVGQQEKNRLTENQPLIDFVFGTDTIDNLPAMLLELYQQDENAESRGGEPTAFSKLGRGEKLIRTEFSHRAPYLVETLIRSPGVSTFVNVTKGCDNFCTFCVVPYTRGREKSRPFDQVIEDIRVLVERGVKEVTLLGQNVNSYESSCGKDFADLLKGVAEKTQIERIRFTTSHPKDFDEKLMYVMRDHQDKICEYIHLPFQSGNTEVLRQMNRGYSRQDYLQKIAKIKQIIPNVVLSTDIIVGFPGETEEQFLDTVSLVEEVGFETIFAFMYSPRPFTKAARFDGQLPEEVKSDRLQRLFDFHNQMAFNLAKKYEGQTLKVLIENYHAERNVMSGRSTQNKTVYIQGGDKSWIGQTPSVRITKANPATMRGELVL